MTRTRMLIWAAVAAAAWLAGCEDKGGAGRTSAPSAAASTAAADPGNKTSAGAGTSAPSAKKYDCGGKEQKPCPMQGWMKRVMAPASASDDGEALAKALGYVHDHAPPGYPDWITIARTGATKAKAGDVDGAKASCKQCHDAYKDRYKATMRDRPF